MKYAVIKFAGHQYKVSDGDVLTVDKTLEKTLVPPVLLYVDDGEVKIGSPYVDKINIKLNKIEDKKGQKLYIRKYKAKSRYRRKIGFRPELSTYLVKLR